MNPVNIKAVARKEFYHLIRDYRSLYLAFIISLLLILVFGYALSLDLNNVEVAVIDHDKTPLTKDFIRQLDASPYFHVGYYLEDRDTAVKYLDQSRIMMAIIFPAGWTRHIKADQESPLQILIDGSDPNFAGLSRGYITGFVEDYNQKTLADFLDRNGQTKIAFPLEARIRVWFNEDLESRSFIVPGIIAIIVMVVGALLTSLIIAREYENGTMETIKSLPIQRQDFLLGKAIPYFFIGLIDVLLAVLMGQVLFGVVLKSSFWLLILAATIYLWVALSLGLLISVITKSQLVANQVAILVTFLPSFLLSNYVFPVVNMPKILQLITYLVPATYFIDIMNGLYLRRLGLYHLWPSYLILLLMFFILAGITCMVLKRDGV